MRRLAGRPLIAAVVIVTASLLAPTPASAQEDTGNVAWSLTRSVLVDPTTFAPAAISYEAMRRDWKTSQVLFAHGWLEANPRFTVSGRPNDVPVSDAGGTRRIRGVALSVLRNSAVNNLAVGIGARLCVARYPSHKTLIRTISWVERLAFASVITYRNSVDHVRQADMNRRIAREYGYSPP